MARYTPLLSLRLTLLGFASLGLLLVVALTLRGLEATDEDLTPLANSGTAPSTPTSRHDADVAMASRSTTAPSREAFEVSEPLTRDPEFDVNDGPYTATYLHSLPLDRLQEIRKMIREQQTAIRLAVKASLNGSEPYLSVEEFSEGDLDLSDALFVPLAFDGETRYYPISPTDDPLLYVWRERVELVQTAPAYLAWIDSSRAQLIENISKRWGRNDYEVRTSPNNDNFAIYLTLNGVRRRIAGRSDECDY